MGVLKKTLRNKGFGEGHGSGRNRNRRQTVPQKYHIPGNSGDSKRGYGPPLPCQYHNEPAPREPCWSRGAGSLWYCSPGDVVLSGLVMVLPPRGRPPSV